MVVPKRAALLLDRLMVALHHALENEREGHRIGDFYANKNMMQIKPTEYKHAHEQPAEDGRNHYIIIIASKLYLIYVSRLFQVALHQRIVKISTCTATMILASLWIMISKISIK